jgi:hypothetical protein
MGATVVPLTSRAASGGDVTARSLMIGLDGADRRLVDRCCREGMLPNIARLRLAGREGRIDTPESLGDDAVWASFYHRDGAQ